MTNRQIAALKGTGTQKDHPLGGGLILRVSADGTGKMFRCQLVRPGTRKRIMQNIGAFNPPHFGIKQASAQVLKMKLVLATGGEPTQVKKTPARLDAEEMTIAELSTLFEAARRKELEPQTMEAYASALRKYIKPTWGTWPVSSLKYGQVMEVLEHMFGVLNLIKVLLILILQ